MGPSYNLLLKKILAGKGSANAATAENYQRTELLFSYLAMLMGQTNYLLLSCGNMKICISKILKIKHNILQQNLDNC
jgi:hypothetical protein